MPLLPALDEAVVPREKVEDYLLDLAHPVGGAKAAFFISFGFRAGAPDTLIASLLEHGRSYEASPLPATPHGAKFSVTGRLRSPDGRDPLVTTIWILDAGATAPRLVTAIPA